MRKLITLIFTALLVAASALPTAARPGSDATLVVTPNAPIVGDSLVFTGCGYTPGVGVTVSVHSPTATAFFGSLADADGCFSTGATEDFVVTVAGDYTASTFQSGHGPNKALVTLAFIVN